MSRDTSGRVSASAGSGVQVPVRAWLGVRVEAGVGCAEGAAVQADSAMHMSTQRVHSRVRRIQIPPLFGYWYYIGGKALEQQQRG